MNNLQSSFSQTNSSSFFFFFNLANDIESLIKNNALY